MSGIVALIPARGGSKRIPNKNIREFCGKPLVVWTIEAARESGVFGDFVYVSTEDDGIYNVAYQFGARIIERPARYATDESPDIEWVKHALGQFDAGRFDTFAILRPSSPFRTAATIKRAWEHWGRVGEWVDSMRAMEPAKQHPLKMWLLQDMRMCTGAMPYATGYAQSDLHSRPTQTLGPVYIQNASLEIAWCATMRETGAIAGWKVAPFLTEGYEGVDLNTSDDWDYATWLLESGRVRFGSGVEAP